VTSEAALQAGIKAALTEARAAVEKNELPYGAVVVDGEGHVVARAHDQVEQDADPTSHGELLAVRRAVAAVGAPLTGHALVSNVEPCAMCFSAAWTAGIGTVAFGLTMRELKALAPDSMDEVVIDSAGLNELAERKLELHAGLRHADCLALWDGRAPG
jgi:tRNA(adenine34) deaminase